MQHLKNKSCRNSKQLSANKIHAALWSISNQTWLQLNNNGILGILLCKFHATKERQEASAAKKWRLLPLVSKLVVSSCQQIYQTRNYWWPLTPSSQSCTGHFSQATNQIKRLKQNQSFGHLRKRKGIRACCCNRTKSFELIAADFMCKFLQLEWMPAAFLSSTMEFKN